MQDTIRTMFVNEKIIKIYSFCPFSPCNTRQIHCKTSIATKTNILRPTPKMPHNAPSPPFRTFLE